MSENPAQKLYAFWVYKKFLEPKRIWENFSQGTPARKRKDRKEWEKYHFKLFSGHRN